MVRILCRAAASSGDKQRLVACSLSATMAVLVRKHEFFKRSCSLFFTAPLAYNAS